MISFADNVDPSQLTDHSRTVVEHMLAMSGNRGCLVTALIRTPHDEARILHDNLNRSVKQMGWEAGVTYQRRVYSRKDAQGNVVSELPGCRVIDVYVAMRSASAEDTIAAMEQKIVELGPKNVTHHCCVPATDKLQTLDIAQSSLDDIPAFEKVVGGHRQEVSKCLDENYCCHIEIPQP